MTVLGFGENDLRSLAGPRSFERGLGYRDAVRELCFDGDTVTAAVYGTGEYEVTLTLGAPGPRGGLDGVCDCPYGQDGHFCKHCVAVGLTVLAQAERVPEQRAAGKARARRLEDWLDSLSRSDLLALVREQLAADRELRRRLELRAATAQADVTAVGDRITDLLDPRPFSRYGCVEYEDAGAYAQQAAEAVTALDALTDAGQAAAAVELAREAIRQLGQVYGEVDDSDGALGTVADGLAEAHLRACRCAPGDPESTAQWLVTHLLYSDHDVPEIDLLDYRDVLGEAGLARVRQLAEQAWRRKPSGWAETYLMESLVRAEGDLDALIALYAADLAPTGATHLAIARELDAADRPAEALQWAERGLAETPGPATTDSDLVDYLTGRYERSGRLPEAVALRRDRFHALRTLDAYRQLRTIARTATCWPSERADALALLRTDARERPTGRYGGSVLIDVLLDDGDPDAAWTAAEKYGATPHQWLTLADHIRDTRPADALPVYLRAVEPRTKITGNANYQEIARLLLRARACHQRLGTEGQFATCITELRTAQKRKRNLLRILDEHGL